MSLPIDGVKRRHTKDGQNVPKLSNDVTANNTRNSCIRDINTTLYSIYLTLKMTYVQAVIDMTVIVTNNNPSVIGPLLAGQSQRSCTEQVACI